MESSPAANVFVRRMCLTDVDRMQVGFGAMGWEKPPGYFRECAEAQEAGRLEVWVAEVDGAYAGHVKVVWSAGERAVPEIQDLATLPAFRRCGIASELMEFAEKSAFERSELIRIGVGLHSGYGQAQRLYARRGWIPDGVGARYAGEVVEEGAQVRLDDECFLYLEKHREQ